jgi:nitroreductase
MDDVFEIMSTTRSMRRLKPDPVPDELIEKILHAGLGAANGGNTQKWRFMVVKDPAKKKAVQEWYKKAFDEVVGPRYASSAPPPGSDPAKYKRQHGAVEYLTDHYHEAPVWIVACLEDGPNPNRSAGSSVYPAVQNMLLAIRALGLPPGVHSYAILPVGYPMGKFGPTGRGKMSEFVYGDKYGETWAPLAGK